MTIETEDSEYITEERVDTVLLKCMDMHIAEKKLLDFWRDSTIGAEQFILAAGHIFEMAVSGSEAGEHLREDLAEMINVSKVIDERGYEWKGEDEDGN